VERHREVWPWKTLEQAVGQHSFGAAARFLRWLEQEHDRAGPLVAMGCEVTSDANEIGHVNVVPARVHHADSGAAFIGCANCGSVRNARLLGDGKRVHIGPEHEHFTGTVLENADHAMTTDVGRNLDVNVAKLLGHAGGGFLFVR
jgi:hypothetical protein